MIFENVSNNHDNKNDENTKHVSNNYSSKDKKDSKNDVILVMKLLTIIRKSVRVIAMTMSMIIIMILTMLVIVSLTTLMILSRL